MAAAIAFILALVAPTLGHPAPGPVLTDAGYEGAFEAWRHRYHKSYATPGEQEAHFAAFRRNYDAVKTTNDQGHSFTLGLNKFGDIAPEDFARAHGSKLARNTSIWGDLPMLGVHRHLDVTLPDSVDWRKEGAVTGVKNQGQCGACWAFSTTGSIESAWAIASEDKQLLSLSEQQLVDCAPREGCDGGLPEVTYDYLQHGGDGGFPVAMCTEGTYPYQGKQGTCGSTRDSCMVAIMSGGITGFKVATSSEVGYSMETLMSAVAQQPVTASIAGGDQLFQLYSGGVLQDRPGNKCSDSVDHSVLLVGYGREGSLDYWLIKNSWGTDWGESGYARVWKGKPGDPVGECGIRSDSAYPVVDISKAGIQLNLPLGTIFAVILVGIALLFVLGCGCKFACKRRAGGSASRAVRGNTERAMVAPAPIAAQALQAPVDPSVRTGNSRSSRLLEG